MTSHTKTSKEKGFIKLFIVIIVVVAGLVYFGLNPGEIWNNFLRPIIEFGFEVFIKVVGFLFGIAIWLVNKVSSLF